MNQPNELSALEIERKKVVKQILDQIAIDQAKRRREQRSGCLQCGFECLKGQVCCTACSQKDFTAFWAKELPYSRKFGVGGK